MNHWIIGSFEIDSPYKQVMQHDSLGQCNGDGVKRFTIHYRQISSKDAFHLTLGPSKVCFQGFFVFRTSICLELKDRSGNAAITETWGGNYCVPLYVLDCWLLLITHHQSPEQTSFLPAAKPRRSISDAIHHHHQTKFKNLHQEV